MIGPHRFDALLDAAQSYVKALAEVAMVGREARTLVDDWGMASRVPALKIGAFSFTGVTA